MRHLASLFLTGFLLLTGCSGMGSSFATEDLAEQAGGDQPPDSGSGSGSDSATLQANLTGIKAFLVSKSTELHAEVAALQEAAGGYYQLAAAADFDYAALWEGEQEQVRSLLTAARTHFLAANSAYELMEGIVAGTPALAHYDIDIDAGVPAAEGPEDVVSFDVHLPNGETLEKPGNYFYLAELTLWGTNPEWTARDLRPDLDGDGTVEFGEVLPNAEVLKGIADGFAGKAEELLADARSWEPTASDAFTALVVMVPTMDEYFQAWKGSRFVGGAEADSPQFVAVSRLQDIADILSGLQVVYGNVRPLIAESDAAQAQQIERELAGLRSFVVQILEQEKAGTRFRPEDADLLGTEAQNRATAIAGQVTQAAHKLGVPIGS